MDNDSWVDPIYNEYGMTQWGWRVIHVENFKLGKNVRIGSFSMIEAEYGVEIEDNVMIGYGCTIMSYSRIRDKRGKVTLKNGCKIGAHSIIMPGVTIGEDALVGANSFVNRDIPEREVWFGTPISFHGLATKLQ